MKFIIFLSFFIHFIYTLSNYNSDAQRLKNVHVLTFFKNAYTTGRRTEPIPQLNQVGGNASYNFQPTGVQCTTSNIDQLDVQWNCYCELDPRVRFGKIDVLCEGYNFPEDEFILKGSCRLEYTLELISNNINENSYNESENLYRASEDVGLTILLFTPLVCMVLWLLWILRSNETYL